MEALTTESRTCDVHGEYEARHLWGKIYTSCPQCDREAQEREATRRAQREATAREDRKQSRLLYSGLQGRFRDASFDSYVARTAEQRNALASCRAFAEGLADLSWRGLLLLGLPGTGKTHLLSAIVRACIESADRRGIYVTQRGLVQRIRATWGREAGETEREVLADLIGADLLAIDEMGTGLGTDSERGHLFDVIDGRYQRERPVILAANLPVPDLRNELGDRLFDRLREGASVVLFNWPSYRGELGRTHARRTQG